MTGIKKVEFLFCGNYETNCKQEHCIDLSFP